MKLQTTAPEISTLPDKPPVLVIALSFVLLFTFLLFAGWGLMRSQLGPVSVGQDAPDFELTTFDGKTFSKKDFTGKVLILHFWSSWCSSCEVEAAILETVWQNYNIENNVIVLGIDYMDTETEALEFLRAQKINYANGPDTGTSISNAYRIRGVPETFIVDPNGRIAYVQIGPFSSSDDVIQVIEQLK
jgi:cytochrome c biogenesis protein CcmG, thiol:disulfide interchange protein DsbE